MSPSDPEPDGPLSPDAAFSALGDDTRLAILRVLGEAEEPLGFTELRHRVGYETTGNFSYHLAKLRDHFITKTDRGYQLRRPGERIVEAILSGAVTDARTVERTRIDQSCPYCDAPLELRYRQERVAAFCTECAGVYGGSNADSEAEESAQDGLLGHLPLPPAGVNDRSMQEIERAAWTWGFREMIALANSVCPRCSATLDQSVATCSEHVVDDGICSLCLNRHAVQLQSRCRNCIFEHEGAFVLKLMTNVPLLAFITDHGLDPILDQWKFGWEYEEEVISTEPFEARFSFEIQGDVLTVTVGDDLSVVDTASG